MRHLTVLMALATLFASLPGRELHAQTEAIYQIQLHSGAVVGITRAHDSVSVSLTLSSATALPDCEQPIAVAKQWADAHAATITLFPGRNTCGIAIREASDGGAASGVGRYFEIAFLAGQSVLHQVVPLLPGEAQTLAALLQEATK